MRHRIEAWGLLARGGGAFAPLRCDCPSVPGVSGRRYEDEREGTVDSVCVCRVCGCERPLTRITPAGEAAQVPLRVA